MNDEHVLITGATGFIGSHVVTKILRDKSFTIIAIVRKIDDYKNVKELEHRGVILIEGSFYDEKLIIYLFEKYPIQHVIHIAAIRGEGSGTSSDYLLVNVQGTGFLLEASLKKRVKKFIYCSSVGVFGSIPHEVPANIKTRLNGDNNYHNSKILAEKKVQEFITRGLNAFIVRPAITYGKNDTGFSSTLIKMVKRKMLLVSFRDNKIHLLDVNKLAEIFYVILTTDYSQNRLFIAADTAPILLRELVDLIHNYYYKKNYPKILKMPHIFFNILFQLFRSINNNKWCVRIQLLYKDWFFNTNELKSLTEIQLSNTREMFLGYLENQN